MKHSRWILIIGCYFFLLPSLKAATLPALNIAIDKHSPPFVMRGANNQIYGFDVQMMQELCNIMNRTCIFHLTRFSNILPIIAQKTADVGIGSITITLDRSKLVTFTIPYLLSYAQYFALNKWRSVPFSEALLNGKKIGIEKGSIFNEAVKQAGIQATIVEFRGATTLIAGLQNGDVDFVLLDATTAQYWQFQTNQAMIPVGKKFLYGYGFGIAVNHENQQLLQALNAALLEFQNNGGFQKDYNEYIAQF